MTVTLSDYLQLTYSRLAPFSDSARLEAQVLAAHILQRPRSYLAAHPELPLDPQQQAALEQSVQRLERGEPLPYVVGHWEFYGLDFLVTPAVLIPRPETELLVEQALNWMASRGRYRVLDCGAGSGCIAVSLAAHQPQAQVAAVDISGEALQVAQANVDRHHLAGRVRLFQADLLPPGEAIFDLVCANLPYIPTRSLENLPKLRYEPRSALEGGPDGLEVVRRLLQAVPPRLAPQAALLLEIEAGQGSLVLEAALVAFPQGQATVLPDLAGRDRLLVIQT